MIPSPGLSGLLTSTQTAGLTTLTYKSRQYSDLRRRPEISNEGYNTFNELVSGGQFLILLHLHLATLLVKVL